MSGNFIQVMITDPDNFNFGEMAPSPYNDLRDSQREKLEELLHSPIKNSTIKKKG